MTEQFLGESDITAAFLRSDTCLFHFAVSFVEENIHLLSNRLASTVLMGFFDRNKDGLWHFAM